MAKKRKTKKEKVQTERRKRGEGNGFVIKEGWLAKNDKVGTRLGNNYRSFLGADLTKTMILTMLVLALELAIWNYLSRH